MSANGNIWLADLDPGALRRYLDGVVLAPIGRNTLTDRLLAWISVFGPEGRLDAPAPIRH